MDSGWESESIWKVLGRLDTGCQEACGVQSIYAIGQRYGHGWTCIGHVLDAPGM
jgi:hypothetical protein